ncbi:MAG: phage tail protein [Rubrivivax sp.]
MGGSKKKQTVGYKYYMGLFIALCHAPVDRVHKQIAGERDAWVGPVDDSTTIEIDKPDLFGGDKREGGIKGVAEIMMGKATQTLSSWARALLPAPHVGYRGVLTVLYDGLISSNSPYMKAWAWRVERVLKGWENDDCWYPEKAPIGLGAADLQALTVAWTLKGGTPLGSNVYTFDAAASSPNIQTRTYSSGSGAVDTVSMRVAGTVELRAYPGSTAVAGPVVRGGTVVTSDATNVYSLVISDPPATYRFNAGVWAPIVTDIAATFDVQVADGATVTLQYETLDDEMIGAQQTLSVTADIVRNARAMNPAHIIVECLTNSEWGDGWPRAMIGPSFTAAADTLHAEGFGLCLLWNRQGEIWDFIDEIGSHIGGGVYQDPRTGLFELKLLRADYNADALQLIESSPDMVESFQRATYGALVNEVTVVYRDWQTNTDASITVQNGACIAAQGGTVSETKQYPGIPTAALAARVAQRDVIASSTPLARATILCDRSAWAMTPGAVFRWRFLQEGLDGVVMRVLDVDRGELADGVIKLVIAEDVFGLPSASYIGTEPSAWEQPDGAAAPPARQQLAELPYRSLVSELSAADLAALDADAAFFGAVAARPSGVALGAEVWSRSSSTATWSDQGPGAFVPAAELDEAIDRLTGTLMLAGGMDLDDVEADDYAIIGTGRTAEWVQVISLDLATSTATVRRGVLDTVPQAWPAGTSVFFDDARSAADPTERATAETVAVKLLTYTSSSTLALEDGVEISATAAQRQARPYPPGNVRINSEYWPALAETPVTLTWAHRDRTQQTAPAAQAWTDGSIGPEAGVTYSLTVRDAATNSTLYSAEGLTSPATMFSAAGSAEAIITLRSVRDGLDCWQPYQHSLVLADGVLAAEEGSLLSSETGALLVADVAGFAISNPRFIIERAGQLVVAAYGTCLVSSDGGVTYSSVSGFDGSSWVPTGVTAARDDGYLVRVVRSFGAGWGAVLVADLDDLEAGYTETVNDVAGGQAWRLYGYPRTTAGAPIAVFGLFCDGTHFWAVGACPADAISLGPRQMFKSSDGITWDVLGALAADPADPNALSGTNVFGTWGSFWPVYPANSSGLGEFGYGVLRREAGRWFMATARAIYYTDDANGVIGWRRCPTGLGEGGTDGTNLQLREPKWIGGHVVAMNGAVFPVARVAVSADNGLTWSTLERFPDEHLGFHLQSDEIGVVGDTVFAYPSGTDPQIVYRSTAPFTAWSKTVAAGFNSGQPNLYLRPTTTGIAAMTDRDQRLWHSADGITFVLANLEEA